MNKKILIGIAIFGGLILVTALFSNNQSVDTEKTSQAEPPVESLPTDVQSVFPTYPNTVVSNFRESIDDDGRIVYVFSLSTTESINEINDWYRDQLSQNGWSIKSDRNVAGYQIIQGEKENLYTSMQAANGIEAGVVTISQQAQVRPQ